MREPATAVPAAKLAPAMPTVAADATVRRMTDLVRWLKITIGQPWRRAWRSSLPSGLTATGWPTASSIGRSLAESL